MKHIKIIYIITLFVMIILPLNLHGSISAEERTDLIDLYNETGGDSWLVCNWKTPPLEIDGFSQVGTESSWTGITVENISGVDHVTRIELGLNNLTGTFPNTLVNLTRLKYLDVSANSMTGTIPTFLSNFNFLETLILSLNQFSGSIPTQLGELSRLIRLDLSYNQLTGAIPGELGYLSRLQYLILNANMLTGEIPSNLLSLESMIGEGIDIRYNAVHTENASLKTFLEWAQIGGEWERSQTIAPTDITPTVSGTTSIQLDWSKIGYEGNTGSYRVFYSTSQGGPYTYFSSTADKHTETLNVTGLTANSWYYFVISTRTDPNVNNLNTVDSEDSEEVSIFLPPSITVTAPNGAERLSGDSAYNITWNALGITNPVKITLWKGGVSLGVIASNVPANSGSYTWTVGQYIGGTAEPGTDYTIKIKETGSNYSDSSDAPFSILALSVTSPNGGENLGLGLTTNITWNAVGLTYNVKITLWQNETLIGTIANNIPNNQGTYSWRIGDYIGGTALAGTGYTIKIKEIGSNIIDSSNAPFTIAAITVTSPNGGESWKIGSTYTITWNEIGITNPVTITLLKNGVFWGTIARNITPGTGSYNWIAGFCIEGAVNSGTSYTVKVTENTTNIADAGNAVFTLRN